MNGIFASSLLGGDMRNIRILYYHRVEQLTEDYNMLAVTPCNFEEQMKYIENHYEVLNLGDSFEEWDKQGKGDAVIITFDDGYYDLFYNALPILEKYHIPATMFITTGYIDSEREFWHDSLHRAIFSGMNYKEFFTLEDEIYGGSWPTGCLQSRVTTYGILRKIFQISNRQKRDIFEKQLLDWAGLEEKGRKNRRALKKSELIIMSENPYVTIGAHCVSHPSLRWLDKHEQKEEILASKSELEKMIGKEIKLFSYPFGSREDYSGLTVEIVKQAMFDKAVVAYGGEITADTDMFQLPRYLVRNYELNDFKNYLSKIFEQDEIVKNTKSYARVEFIGKFEDDKSLFDDVCPIIIWGIGENGINLYNELVKYNMKNRILGFGDNDQSKWHQVINGVKVYGIEEIIDLCDEQNCTILIKNMHGWEICTQLVEKKMDKIHLLVE